MKIIITESQLNELKYGYHASTREFERIEKDYYDVYFFVNINGERIKKIVGRVNNTDKIKLEIYKKLRDLDDMNFPMEDSIGVLLYNYNLKDLNNIKFNDKFTKIWVKKVMDEYPDYKLKMWIDERGGGRTLSDGYLYAIIKDNTLVTILFTNNETIKTGSVDKIITI